MSKKIEQLQRERRLIQRSIIKAKEYSDNAIAEKNVAALELLQIQCADHKREFDSLQSQLGKLCPAEPKEEIDNFEDDLFEQADVFQSSYLRVMSAITEALQKLTESKSSNPRLSLNTTMSHSSTSNVAFPKIQLPTFDGSITKFTDFKALYENMVHDDAVLTNVRKFYYLKSSLVGEAADVLRGVQISDSGYILAWKKVLDKYDNQSAIIRAHCAELFQLERIKSEAGLYNLLNRVDSALAGLSVCGAPVEQWSIILVYWISTKLDDTTKRDWENASPDKHAFPTWEKFRKFLQNRATAAESRELERQSLQSTAVAIKPIAKKTTLATFSSKCHACPGQHLLVECGIFQGKSPKERADIVRAARLCFNCFNSKHPSSKCPKSTCCKLCQAKHHTLLHFNRPAPTLPALPVAALPTPTVAPMSAVADKPSVAKTTLSCSVTGHQKKSVLLPTAVVRFQCGNISGYARIILDSCSEPTLISASFVKSHQLPTVASPWTTSLKSVSSTPVICDRTCSLQLTSRYSNFTIEVEAEVIPMSALAYQVRDLAMTADFSCFANLPLADPAYEKAVVNIPTVDLIIGAEYYDSILLNQTRKLEALTLRKTGFGWTVSGPVPAADSAPKTVLSYSFFVTADVQSQLKKFWEIEEATPASSESRESTECSRMFDETFCRQPDGRCMVRLPFRETVDRVSQNYYHARSVLLRLEQRLDPATKKAYVEFLRDYESKGHMSRVDPANFRQGRYYLPHLCVLRPSSESTKLRVVFNASAHDRAGISLNAALMVGPRTQPDLFDILVRFRQYPVALSADIAQMYRQVLVHPCDRPWQRILWRESADLPIEEFELNTITYGTSSASFLATKCLEMVSRDLSPDSPAASTLRSDFYMDDLVSGSHSVESAATLQRSLQAVLSAAGFPLCKYRSNSTDLLSVIPAELHSKSSSVDLAGSAAAPVLGLQWDTTSDCFHINFDEDKLSSESKVTMRSVVSDLSKIFDPLGLVSPITIRAKLLLQDLWREQLKWDDEVPSHLRLKITKFLAELPKICNFAVPRCYFPTATLAQEKSRLVGFCDASKQAYAAVVYLCWVSGGKAYSQLVCSKTRVAPIKELTIPKLELQAAVLLSRLIVRVASELQISEVVCFSDAQVVLSWFNNPHSKLPTFVSNRVKAVLEVTSLRQWGYVDTDANPADIATRANVSIESFLTSRLWCSGPEFLANIDFVFKPYSSESIESPIKSTVFHVSRDPAPNSVIFAIEKCSSYVRLLNIFTFVAQWAIRGHIPTTIQPKLYLRQWGLWFVIRAHQVQHFAVEFADLEKGTYVNSKSRLKSLVPFVDGRGILRVGGRLEYSKFSFDKKHPIILHAKSQFVESLVRHIHYEYYHANRLFIITFASARYYVIGGLVKVIKKVVRMCPTCIRYSGQVPSQLMGQLPPERVTVQRPFASIGIDLAGPFQCKCINHRTVKYYKVWVAIFVCFTTRAVHVEIVVSLSTESFVNALQRFIGRRGKPGLIWSDNGTNFVGTSNLLSGFLAREEINWSFIQPRAPNQGGLWEAAIKSVKRHLVKVTLNQALSWDEYSTVLTNIERILNSRPLCYESTTNSYHVITPGHFLVGDRLTSVPELEDPKVSIPLSYRYKCLRNIIASFWQAWRSDYLRVLQKRVKWSSSSPSLNAGQVVIIRDELLPPGEWKCGRVSAVYPDRLGHVRNVDVQMSNGSMLRRACCSLLPLPKDNEN